MSLLLASLFYSPQGDTALPLRPLPDATFGVFLDAATLQDFTAGLPVPAQEALRERLGLFQPGKGVAVAFLGTSAKPYELALTEIEQGPHLLVLRIALRRDRERGRRDGPFYPLAVARLRHLPQPPLDVRFVGEANEVLATLKGVRPLLLRGGDSDPEMAGDRWGVVHQVKRRVELRCGRDCPYPPGPGATVGIGETRVRVHDSEIELFYTLEGKRLWVYGTLPVWLSRARSLCRLTDRSAESIAAAREADIYARPTDVLVLGQQAVSLGPTILRDELPGGRLPERVWLACDWSLSSGGFRDRHIRDLGTWVIDMYPVALHFRRKGTLELIEVAELYHDIRIRFRLHPPAAAREGNVPLRLLIHDPPWLARTMPPRRLGAFLYHGFDRDPNRGPYMTHLGKDGNGRWYTWLALQDPENAYEFELYSRLGECHPPSAGAGSVLSDELCNTNTAVQLFYSHAQFLKAHGLKPPVTLRLSLESPLGYESKPFEVHLGDEPVVPWTAEGLPR